jgi:spermidine/putrescine transport system substrate-binding protein
MSTVKKSFATLVFFTSFLTALTGCKKSTDASTGHREVNLAIWGNYLNGQQAEIFTQKTGIKINISTYASNEELLAKVQAGAAGIDVAVPSDYMVSIMTKLGVLEELDKSKIPNAAQVSTELLNQTFDPQNKFSFPYAWATAGIAVNRELFKGTIKSWKDVFTNPELAGRISLLDDVREVTAAALKYNGYSVNTINPVELKAAEATLLKLKPKVKMFRSDTIDSLLKKEIIVAHSYSTDALQAVAQSGGKIEYVLPEEGGTRSIDNLVILKSAKNKAEAHELINYLLSSDVNLNFVKTVWGGPVLKTTQALLPENMKTSGALFPPASKMSKFESIQDLGENTRLYDELWTKVKTD